MMIPLATGETVTVQPISQVIGATFAFPTINITTATPHNLQTNDIVSTLGITGNLTANGQFVITVVDSTHFSLNNSVGIAAYTGGGIVEHTGRATPGVVVDNTVFRVPIPPYAIQARVQSLSYTSVRIAICDALDQFFYTEQNLITSQRFGPLMSSNDSMYTARDCDVPDSRVGMVGAYLRMKLLFPSAVPGNSVTFSGWVAY